MLPVNEKSRGCLGPGFCIPAIDYLSTSTYGGGLVVRLAKIARSTGPSLVAQKVTQFRGTVGVNSIVTVHVVPSSEAPTAWEELRGLSAAPFPDMPLGGTVISCTGVCSVILPTA